MQIPVNKVPDYTIISIETVFQLPSLTDCLCTLTIEKGVCNEYQDTLSIKSYAKLNTIRVKKNSFKKLYRLEISKCPCLERILVDNGEKLDILNNTCYAAFECLHDLVLSSLL